MLSKHRATFAVVTALLAGSMAACGGITQFSGHSGPVVGTPPPPPPAPAPTPTPAVVVAPVVRKRVMVTAEKVEINEKIQFESGKALIKPESNGLLDEIAKVMKDATQIKKVEVQGHASSEGDAAGNKKLSDDRAKAVMAAIVARGVKAEILTAKGYGIEKPIADNKTDEGKEKNRRVEFVILDPAPKVKPAAATPAAATPATPAVATPAPATPKK
jgi:outer membrane protein OmpA-like peptidoglycan-associated protein